GTVLIAPTARPDPDPEPVAIAEAVTGDAETNASNDVNSAEAPATEETPSEQVAESAPEPDAPSAPSDSEIALSASERTQEDIVIAEGEAEQVSDKLVTDAPGSEEQVTLSEENPAEEQAPEPADSPAIVLADETGVKVLQPAPQPVAPKLAEDETQETVANLVIDTITYDAEGDVALSGRGAGESFARVYVDDTAVKTVPINPDGTWDAPLPEITAGIYNLRIDEVDPEGAVTSRVETPFKRETPEVVAEASTRPNAVTVQEGFTLWAIAKDRFGDGTQYVRVYEANRDLIRDPDLIYPGQIFEIPEG
ncbi:MAG: LysM peptidoglycan-binding domain-containing protein, partial [Pseudomonadota bacterium]